MTTLQEFLKACVEDWDRIAIRVYQDGKWQSLFLSQIKDSNQILVWMQTLKGNFFE